MWFRFIFLCFLLILLVSIFFSANNHFVCYVEVYAEENRLNTVYAGDSIQQERLPVSLEVGRIYFWSLGLSI